MVQSNMKTYRVEKQGANYSVITYSHKWCEYCLIKIGGVEIEIDRKQAADVLHQCWRRNLLSR